MLIILPSRKIKTNFKNLKITLKQEKYHPCYRLCDSMIIINETMHGEYRIQCYFLINKFYTPEVYSVLILNQMVNFTKNTQTNRLTKNINKKHLYVELVQCDQKSLMVPGIYKLVKIILVIYENYFCLCNKHVDDLC